MIMKVLETSILPIVNARFHERYIIKNEIINVTSSLKGRHWTMLENKYWINDVKESNKPNAIANTVRKFKVHASFVIHRVATVTTRKSRVNRNVRIVEYPRDVPI